MNPSEILTDLAKHGIQLALKADGNLAVTGEKSALTSDMIQLLKTNKASLVAHLDQGINKLEKVPSDIQVKLTAEQKRLWFLDQLGFQAAYNTPVTYQIKGALNIDALRQSVDLLYKNHASLRLQINEPPGLDPILKVQPYQSNNLELVTIEENELKVRLDKHENHIFTLNNASLGYMRLLVINDQLSYLIINLHHLISDGWSNALLCREISFLYKTIDSGHEAKLNPLAINYRDYAHWHNAQVQKIRAQRLEYWQKKLQGAPTTLDLPKDHPYPDVQSTEANTKHFSLSDPEFKSLQEIGKPSGLTLFQTYFSIFSLLIHRLSQQDDCLIGTAMANRPLKALESLVGFFASGVQAQWVVYILVN